MLLNKKYISLRKLPLDTNLLWFIMSNKKTGEPNEAQTNPSQPDVCVYPPVALHCVQVGCKCLGEPDTKLKSFDPR